MTVCIFDLLCPVSQLSDKLAVNPSQSLREQWKLTCCRHSAESWYEGRSSPAAGILVKWFEGSATKERPHAVKAIKSSRCI